MATECLTSITGLVYQMEIQYSTCCEPMGSSNKRVPHLLRVPSVLGVSICRRADIQKMEAVGDGKVPKFFETRPPQICEGCVQGRIPTTLLVVASKILQSA